MRRECSPRKFCCRFDLAALALKIDYHSRTILTVRARILIVGILCVILTLAVETIQKVGIGVQV